MYRKGQGFLGLKKTNKLVPVALLVLLLVAQGKTYHASVHMLMEQMPVKWIA